MQRFPILVLFSLGALSAQTVYLRDNPHGFTITGATNTNPIVLTVSSVAGLTSGSIVSISGVCATDGVNSISTANGVRKVGTIAGNMISLTDLSGNPIAANGPWCSGYNNNGWPPNLQMGGLMGTYSVASGLTGSFFDGTTGAVTRAWALGTQNGLANTGSCPGDGICVSANVATVTTTYPHGVVSTNHVSVFGTTNSTLNRNGASTDYTVSAATTYTFSFPTSGVSNGDYTANLACGPGATPNETIQGTDNCVRISQQAVTTNPWWNEMLTAMASGSYKFYVDGGNYSSTDLIGTWDEYAIAFSLDQSNASYLAPVMYGLTNLYKIGGSAFIVSEFSSGGMEGNYDIAQSPNWYGSLANIFAIGQPYLTSADQTAAIGQILNDIADPSPCTKTLFLPHDVLATGSTVAATTSTITLASSDTQPSGYYVNAMVYALINSENQQPTDATITAYDATTKIATINFWDAGTPNPGDTYTITSTITASNQAAGATATVTGYFTHFTTDVHVGDFVFGSNIEYSVGENSVGRNGSWVTAVNSDTSLTVINSNAIKANPTTPQMYVLSHKWVTGDCGILWVQRHYIAGAGAQPIQYPPSGGSAAVGYESNYSYLMDGGWDSVFTSIGSLDSRTTADLANQSIHTMDVQMGPAWNYITGVAADGSSYGLHTTYPGIGSITWWLSHAIVGYPSVYPSGAWVTGYSIYKMYSALINQTYLGWSCCGTKTVWLFLFGDNNAGVQYTAAPGNGTSQQLVQDYGQAWNPTAPSSQYLKGWLNYIGYPSHDTSIGSLDFLSVAQSPNIVSADYTAQPRQYLFQASSQAPCQALTSWFCPANATGSIAYQHSSWTDQTSSDLFFSGRTFFDGGHDWPDPGTIQLVKVGYLLADDNMPIGEVNGVPDNQTGPMFGNATFNYHGRTLAYGAKSYIPRWASANSGSWPSAYGDQYSRYMYALVDMTGMYTINYNVTQRAAAHFQKAGLEEILVEYDDIDATGNATSIQTNVHYPQNGETAASESPMLAYDEGTTTCPGSGGCASLNANRTILESENGVNNGHGDPTPQYNLISRFIVPSGAPNLFIHYDGTSYPNANGHTNRVSICADASSTGACGATGQSKFELLVVHKVATQPDTTFSPTPLNPDANWTGFQNNDTADTGGHVFLHARGGITQSTMAGFTTTHAGTAQYLFAGLTAGNYAVTVNGTPVTGSPFTVGANDNTLYFESTAGTVSVNGSAPTCSITTTTLPSGTVGVSYSQTIATANCTAPITWSIASGSLPAGLTLGSSTGTVSGTPTTAQTSPFVIQAVDSVPTTTTQSLSITIASAGGGLTPSLSGVVGGITIRH